VARLTYISVKGFSLLVRQKTTSFALTHLDPYHTTDPPPFVFILKLIAPCPPEERLTSFFLLYGDPPPPQNFVCHLFRFQNPFEWICPQLTSPCLFLRLLLRSPFFPLPWVRLLTVILRRGASSLRKYVLEPLKKFLCLHVMSLCPCVLFFACHCPRAVSIPVFKSCSGIHSFHRFFPKPR